jgi:hypothetical protein
LAAKACLSTRWDFEAKQPGHSQAYYDSMEQTLQKNGLLKNALFIGTVETRDHFKGKP